MIGYIIGTVIGSISMVFCLGLFIFLYLRVTKEKRLIQNIGRTAEQKVNEDLKIWAKYTKNKFINASVYKYNHNYFFETDSILVTNKGVIVVEVKSIKGGIEGKANELKWLKVSGGEKTYVTNSIIQNDKHINHIIKMIKQKVPMVSLIVYSNKTQYLKIEDVPQHVVITRHIDLFDVLDQLNSSLNLVFTEEQVKLIFKKISSFKTKEKKDLLQFKKIYSQDKVVA